VAAKRKNSEKKANRKGGFDLSGNDEWWMMNDEWILI
jgi:hypothetical protein